MLLFLFVKMSTSVSCHLKWDHVKRMTQGSSSTMKQENVRNSFTVDVEVTTTTLRPLRSVVVLVTVSYWDTYGSYIPWQKEAYYGFLYLTTLDNAYWA